MTSAGGQTGASAESAGNRVLTLLAALVVGVAGGLVSVAFRLIADWSSRGFRALDSTSGAAALVAVLGVPAAGGLAVGWILRTADPVREPVRGTRDFVLAVLKPGARIGLTARRVVSTALTIGSGGSAGCEGAVAQAGSGLGAWLGGRLGLAPYRMQVIAACGIAASLGGLLQAPLAGCLLAAEIVLGGYAVRSIVALGVSAFTSTFLARSLLSSGATLTADFELVTPLELVAYLGIGLVCGLVAQLFVFTLDSVGRVRDRIGLRPWMQPAAGGLVVAAIGMAWPPVRGAGYGVLGAIVTEPLMPAFVGALLLAKIAATSMTVGSGGAGGLFTPSLLVGAGTGSLIGSAMNHYWPHATGERHSYAIVGMSALVAATTRAPLASIMLATELSGNYLVAMPATIAVVAAVFTTSALRDETSSVMRIARHGVGAVIGRSPGALEQRSVGELMRETGDAVRADATMQEVVSALRACRDDMLIVCDPGGGGRVVGVVKLEDLKTMLGQETVQAGTASDVMVEAPVLRRSDTLAQALSALTRTMLPALPVVDADGALQGVVTRYDVMNVCAQQLLRGYVGLEAPEQQEPAKELTPQSHQVCAVPVPRPFAGRTLREIDLVRRWGVACVGIRRPTEAGQLQPVALDQGKPLRSGDVLILIGDRANMDRLMQLERASERPGS